MNEHQIIRLEGSRDPSEFLRVLREKVSIGDLLSSRHAQAILAKCMEFNFTRDQRYRAAAERSGRVMLINPNPVVILNDPQRGGEHIHTVFLLKGQEHFYFFPVWNPAAAVPPYLRPQDVVPSETYSRIYPPHIKKRIMEELRISEEQFSWLVYEDDPRVTSRGVLQDIPFNKPICRVPVLGGEAMLFNYNRFVWEPSGQGVYAPDSKTKMSFLVRSLVNKFSYSATSLDKKRRLPPKT